MIERSDCPADDRAFAGGVGFTDIVKRPTAKASELRAEEFEYGRRHLLDKLAAFRPGVVIFTFKQAATHAVKPFRGDGLTDEPVASLAGFVMPARTR